MIHHRKKRIRETSDPVRKRNFVKLQLFSEIQISYIQQIMNAKISILILRSYIQKTITIILGVPIMKQDMWCHLRSTPKT